jgi:hypothetical protein
MRKRTKIMFALIAMVIILIGGIVPNLPSSWTSEFPAWFINFAIVCGVLLILLNCFWFLQDIDGIVNKKKKIIK